MLESNYCKLNLIKLFKELNSNCSEEIMRLFVLSWEILDEDALNKIKKQKDLKIKLLKSSPHCMNLQKTPSLSCLFTILFWTR
jgi:hypothetical protein